MWCSVSIKFRRKPTKFCSCDRDFVLFCYRPTSFTLVHTYILCKYLTYICLAFSSALIKVAYYLAIISVAPQA